MLEIYLDNAATTRPSESVVQAMLPFLRERFGNPSSLHRRGVAASRAIEDARVLVARAKAKRPGIVVHSDGVQALGKLEPPRGVDLYSVSAHKVHGPQGVGALAVARGARLLPQIEGGGQEGGVRAGTENLAAIVG